MEWNEILETIAEKHTAFAHNEDLPSGAKRCTFVYAHDEADLADHWSICAQYPTLQALQERAALTRASTVTAAVRTGFRVVQSVEASTAKSVSDAQSSNVLLGYQVLHILETMQEDGTGSWNLAGFDITGTLWQHEPVEADNLVMTTFSVNMTRDAFDPYADTTSFYNG